MDSLIFNSVLRIESGELQGLHRVLAVQPDGDVVWLACIGRWDESDDRCIPQTPSRLELHRVAVSCLESLNAEG